MKHTVGTLLKCTDRSCSGYGCTYEIIGVNEFDRTYRITIHEYEDSHMFKTFTSDNIGFFDSDSCFDIIKIIRKQVVGW